MRPAIRALISPDADDFLTYRPADPDCFGLPIQMLAGPQDGPGEESFNITVCTPAWLAIRSAERPFLARHMVVVTDYNWTAILSFIEQYVRSCEGSTWREVAEKLGRLGQWEFEDYQPGR